MEMFKRFSLNVLSMAAENHLFMEELGWEGLMGWWIGLLKAMVDWFMLAHPPTCFHHGPF